jgi:hypothetical protein
VTEEEVAVIERRLLACEGWLDIYLGDAAVDMGSLISEVRRLREALRDIANRADTEYWQGADPDFGDLMSIEQMAREALAPAHDSTSRVW